MLAPRILVLALTVTSGSACSADPESPVESSCRRDILKSTPRPETAEFSDFFELTTQEYGYLLAGMMIDNLPERRAGEPRYVYAAAESAILTTSRDIASRTASRGALFYRYKVSMKDRLDRPRPSVQICFAQGDRCTCLSRDTFSEDEAARRRR